jgi:hypothetical protein
MDNLINRILLISQNKIKFLSFFELNIAFFEIVSIDVYLAFKVEFFQPPFTDPLSSTVVPTFKTLT